jgi:hypothetical protein
MFSFCATWRAAGAIAEDERGLRSVQEGQRGVQGCASLHVSTLERPRPQRCLERLRSRTYARRVKPATLRGFEVRQQEQCGEASFETHQTVASILRDFGQFSGHSESSSPFQPTTVTPPSDEDPPLSRLDVPFSRSFSTPPDPPADPASASCRVATALRPSSPPTVDSWASPDAVEVADSREVGSTSGGTCAPRSGAWEASGMYGSGAAGIVYGHRASRKRSELAELCRRDPSAARTETDVRPRHRFCNTDNDDDTNDAAAVC